MQMNDAVIASLIAGYVHPTTVLNTLVALENEGGVEALQRFEATLLRYCRGPFTELFQAHPRYIQSPQEHTALASAWLAALRQYCQQYKLDLATPTVLSSSSSNTSHWLQNLGFQTIRTPQSRATRLASHTVNTAR